MPAYALSALIMAVQREAFGVSELGVVAHDCVTRVTRLLDKDYPHWRVFWDARR